MHSNYLRAIGAYLVAWTLGSLCGLTFWFFVRIGLIRVYGLNRVREQMHYGNHVIMSNHPSLKDPFILLGMWWPWCLDPLRFSQLFPWSMPAKTYFPKWLPDWVYPVIHAIPIIRAKEAADEAEKKKNGTTIIKKVSWIMKTYRNLIVHPEEGRTGSPRRSDDKPPQEFEYSNDRSRKIRYLLKAQILRMAAKNKTSITPTYIVMPNLPETYGYRLWGWRVVEIHFGETYTPDPDMSDEELLRDLASRILEAPKT